MFELPNVHLHVVIVCSTVSCQSIDKVLPRSRFSGSKMEQSTSSCFSLSMQSFTCSLCNHLNCFLRSKNCRYTLRICKGILQLQRIHSGLILVSVGVCGVYVICNRKTTQCSRCAVYECGMDTQQLSLSSTAVAIRKTDDPAPTGFKNVCARNTKQRPDY